MCLRKGVVVWVTPTCCRLVGKKSPRCFPQIICKSALPNLLTSLSALFSCVFSFFLCSSPVFLFSTLFTSSCSVSCLFEILLKIVNSNFFFNMWSFCVLIKLIFHSAFFLSFRIYVKPLIQSYPNPFKNDLKCKLGILWRLKVYWHFWSTFVWTKTSIVKSVKYIFFYCLFKWT